MQLPGRNEQTISLNEASQQTRNFRLKASADAIKGGLFWKENVQKLLDQSDCVALRYYYGNDDKGLPTIVLVGVTSDGKDITDGIILEYAWPCPPFCDDPHLLNS